MMKLLSVLMLMSCFMVGCTSLHKSQKNGSIDVRIKSDLAADIEVDMTKIVKGTAHQSRLFWIFDIKGSNQYAEGVTYNGTSDSSWFGPGLEEKTKSAAAFNAVVPNKVDVLVAPQYLIKVNSILFGLYKEVTATVTGYSGKVKDIKQVKHKE